MNVKAQLNERIMKGWNTWDTRNVLSFSHLPDGFEFNIGMMDYSLGRVVREFMFDRKLQNEEKVIPGIRSYDGSYTEVTVEFGKSKFFVQSAVIDGEQAVLLTPIEIGVKAPAIFVEAGILWGNPGYVRKNGEKLTGVLEDREIDVYVNGPRCTEKNFGLNNPYITVSLETKVGISTGRPMEISEIEARVTAEKEKLLRDARRFGDSAESALAMKSVLAWNTIYEPRKKEICTPVSRTYNSRWLGCVLFCWDTFFAANMISVENKDLAYANIFAILDKLTDQNFIPGLSAANTFVSYDRTQPPVGSMAVLNIYNRYHEKDFVEAVFEPLEKWNEWFFRKRMVENGTLCWGAMPYKAIMGNRWEPVVKPMLESGLDNSPMYDKIPRNEETQLMELSDVGLTGLYIHDCSCLIQLGRLIGRDTKELEARMAKAESGLHSLWSETDGIFLNRRTDTGEISHRISPTNFYSLFSEQLTKEQAGRMVAEHLLNEEEFWGEYVIPSISKKDPAFRDQDYWRGRIWGPMNYLVYEALKFQGFGEVCTQLAEKSERMFMLEWNENKHVCENYSPFTGMGRDEYSKNNASDCFYHWGSLLAYIKVADDLEKGAK